MMQTPWGRAQLVAALFSVDRLGFGGIDLRAWASPVRSQWFDQLTELLGAAPLRKLPLNTSESRLLGGLNIPATLRAGKPILEAGLLTEWDNQTVQLVMAERADNRTIAHLCSALDHRMINVQRDGFSATQPAGVTIIACNEATEDEALSPALLDRLGFSISLHDIALGDCTPLEVTRTDIEQAQNTLANIALDQNTVEAIAALSIALGVQSPRAWLFAARAAAALAALEHRSEITEDDILHGATLTLAPRATRIPDVLDQESQQQEPPPAQQPQQDRSDDSPENTESNAEQQTTQSSAPDAGSDQPIDSEAAMLPAELLAHWAAHYGGRLRHAGQSGKSGSEHHHKQRGRPCGTRPGDPRRGHRLHLVATLRAAAPWQTIRRRQHPDAPGRVIVHKDDLRVTRFKHRQASTTVFVVDASGSAAMHRLAETKGAVELLLANCYSRRDSVALISFRGTQAETLLAPTRSLVRAKKTLAALPGGGGTPLASAIESATALGRTLQQNGNTPTMVFLTDGVANIALDGTPGRPQANADTLIAAKRFQGERLNGMVIDISPRGHDKAKALASALSAHYVALPHANAQSLYKVISAGG
jgi:magnesium chelatase subunit D